VAKRIGELLVEGGILSQSQLEQALFAQRKDGRKLGQLLIELGLVSEVQLTQTLSRQLSVPWVSLYHVDFSRSLLNLLPRDTAEKYCLVPIFVRRVRKQGDTLYVAMDDPTNEAALADVTRAAQLPVKPMIACASDIRAAIRVYYGGEEPAAPQPPPPSVPDAHPPLPVPPGGHAEVPPRPSVSAAVVPIAAVPPPPPSVVRPPPPPPPPPAAAAVGPPPSSVGPESRSGEIIPADTVPQAKKGRARMISLTLLDGTTISLPAPGKKARGSKPDVEEAPRPGDKVSDQLTARDLVSALRAVSHGVDASEILGSEPRWEAMFSALLSILLRKGLIADWEFIEEFRKI
jgi:type IV pilus assembly protein PilB